jgi:pectate lyase
MVVNLLKLYLTIAFAISMGTGYSALADEQLAAFPGAEGFGAYTPGGRGGKVINVTNLNDSGPGSLRAAVEAQGPRIVVFCVSGYIDLKKPLRISHPYITIAGQTAPGDGVCLRNYELSIGNTHDIVVRYLRSRPGDRASKASEMDAISIWDAHDVIIDHCSATWSTDESLSVTGHSDNITVQWCIIGEALTKHSYGSIIGSHQGKITFHHNLYANNISRNPRPGSYNYDQENANDPGPTIDFRNNVVYNWNWGAGYSGSGVPGEYENFTMNYVGNYLKPGPDTQDFYRTKAFSLYADAAARIYMADNFMEGFAEGTADNGLLFYESGGVLNRLAKPVSCVRVKTDEVKTAYSEVLLNVGAIRPVRDGVDTRLVAGVREGRGRIRLSLSEVGGWPQLGRASSPADTDLDGIPDKWETTHDLDPKDALDAGGDKDGDGYTNIEEYLNGPTP